MTISEAQNKGIRHVRLPEWNPLSYLELPALDAQGFSGPWTKLYHPIGTAALKATEVPCSWPIMVLWFDWNHRTDFGEFMGTKFTPEDVIAGRHNAHH